MQHFGSAKNVWETSKTDLECVFGIGSAIAKHIGKSEILDSALKEIHFCEKHGIDILIPGSENYPRHLKNIPDLPAVLYKKGSLDFSKTFISIVGTRNSTIYGRSFLKSLFEQLKDENVCIVSGLAIGTDSFAHQMALDYQIPTIAVLAHGLHMIYPAENKKMAQQIVASNGAILTEFNSSQQAIRQNFIQRNRIIAGLSPLTLVVESAFGGGSISTANFAYQYDREVLALPGRIDDKFSQGCNFLIAHQKANIIHHHQDVLKYIEKKTHEIHLFSAIEDKIPTKLKPKDHLEVFELIASQPLIHLDEMCHILEMPSFKLLPILLNFELEDFIRSNSSKQFQVI